MSLPALLEVGVHTYSTGQRDRYNTPVPVYTPAKDQPGTRLKVFGWTVRASTEPPGPGPSPHNIVVTEVDLYAASDFPIGPDDLVDLPDGQYDVIGEPQGFQHGPFGSCLGVVVKLRKAII